MALSSQNNLLGYVILDHWDMLHHNQVYFPDSVYALEGAYQLCLTQGQAYPILGDDMFFWAWEGESPKPSVRQLFLCDLDVLFLSYHPLDFSDDMLTLRL